MSSGYTHGIGKLNKPSTRVIHRPGGDSTLNIFATQGEEGAKKVNECQASRNKSSVFSSGTTPEEQPKSTIHNTEEYKLPEQTKSSTRVLNPPGGQTSVNLFGGSEPTTDPIHKKTGTNPYEHKTDLYGGQAASAGDAKPQGNRRQPPGGASHNIFG